MPDSVSALMGIAAEFADSEALIAAVHRLRETGYRRFEAFSPFPIEGLAEAEGFHEGKIGLATLVGGVLGAATGYGMQVYTNLDFPVPIGGRALIANPAFMLITFELMVLFAVTAGILAMLILNRLPKLHHPVFDIERFSLASLDRFFLVLDAADPSFEYDRSRALLRRLGAVHVERLAAAEPGS